ncbi:MAG: hypothetical protein B6244_03495 [Candidatus Cloacimonetes bacterium 4572_55]|nr:MAG: hypothetical protein B6244_03495 [Candidatus Cloacimonetes bacterium 4572_55]
MNKKPEVAIFFFADAFGWEILKRYKFLKSICPYKHRLDTVFGYSSTAMPSIFSGRIPSSHGHFSCFYYSPETSPFKILKWMKLLPSSIADRGRVRNIISRLLTRLYGFTGYFQIYNVPFDRIAYFDYSEKDDIFKPGGLLHGESIFDELEKHQITYHCPDWHLSDQDQIDSLYQELEKQKITWAFMHTARLDNVMHLIGTKGEKVDKVVAWYEEQAQRLWDQAHKYYERVSFYFFSDHGMTDVTDQYDVRSKIEVLGLEFGKDYAAFYDSTMARIWFLNDQAEKKIKETLSQLDCGRIVSEEELDKWGVNFPDHKYGDLIFLMNPGHLIIPGDMGLRPIPGMHGYDPEDLDSYAHLSTNVKLDPPPRSIADMYQVMLQDALR